MSGGQGQHVNSTRGVGWPVSSTEGVRPNPHCRYEEENFVRLPTRRKASVPHRRHGWNVLQVTHTLITCAGQSSWSQFHFG